MRLSFSMWSVMATMAALSALNTPIRAAEPVKVAAVDKAIEAAPAKKTSPQAELKTANAAPAAAGAASKVAPPKAKPKRVAPSLRISVDLTRQRMTVKENGKVRYTWKISSGRRGYRTVTGTYRPQWMARMHYSRKYDNAPMPHSIFFHRGYAIHATYATGRLGAPASHGCVRLAPSNAKRLFRLVQKHGKARTRISVFGTAKDRYVAKKKKPRTTRRTVRRTKPRNTRKTTYSYNSAFANSGTRYTWPGDRPRNRVRYGRY